MTEAISRRGGRPRGLDKHIIGIWQEDWEILHSYQLWKSREIGKPISIAEAIHHLLIHVAREAIVDKTEVLAAARDRQSR